MSRLSVFLLGMPRVERDGEPVQIPRRKAIALLAYLAMTGHSHSRDALATLFWPEGDQSQARAGLRRALASLRKALGKDCLDADRETVVLNPNAEIWLDVSEFQDRLGECRTHGHPPEEACPTCLSSLAEAAALYRNDFLSGFTLRDSPAFDEWQFFQTQGLRDDLASALERLAHGYSEQGEFEQAIPYARRWLALDPLHEPAHRCLMQLYDRSGQRAAALRQYMECERILQEELGVPPQEETAQLFQAVKEGRERAAEDSQPERYRLERKISDKGSFGDVWLATDTRLDRPVAVKCPKVAHDPAQRERFVTEARMLARLNHPNITQVYDALFDEGEGRFYLVMEYVDGRDLSEIIGAGTPFPLDRVLEVAMGILQALSYAHGQGVVHRDVKPDNVMIADDVKLTDFGLADLRSILQRGTHFLVGSPAYMAPEQIEGRAVDGRADLYALGVILFEMIAGGRLPFDCADGVEMLNAHLRATPPPLSQFAPTVPPALEQVVTRLLAKDPEERYPSAEAVMEVLSTVPVGPRLHNLPVQLTPFVGREAVLAEIAERLEDPACRLLTLVGPGGCGKTRLALKAAEAQLDHYPHGIFFVSLAPLQSVDAIVPTVAEALGFSFCATAEGSAAVEPRQQLLDYLRQKAMLLIMDNFEHLLACPERRPEPVEGPGRREGAGLVTEILKTASDVKILATSRARLNVGGEHRFQVSGMSFPRLTPLAVADAVWYSAIKLFLQGARRAQPGFELTDENLSGVVDVCRLVEGMPLGIRLAAAWVVMLTPAEIASEIGQSLNFLTTELHDVPERQRSMRAVFDHSWNLLTARERAVMQALSVFRGGFTREAAQQVTGASLRELMSLVNKSLLDRTSTPSATLRIGGRYKVHELLRQYAAEKLDESPTASEAVRDRHSAYYAAALQQWEVDLKGSRQLAALTELDMDIGNARAAWNWAVEQGQVERLDQAIEGLRLFYGRRRRYQEGEAACQLAAEKLEATASGGGLRVLVKILVCQSFFSRALHRTELASQLMEQGLALLKGPELADQDTRPERAFVLHQVGRMAFGSDRDEAGRLLEQSLALYQALGDQWGTANVLWGLGFLTFRVAAYSEGEQLLEKCLALYRALGDQWGTANALWLLGWLSFWLYAYSKGRQLFEESLTLYQALGDQWGITRSLEGLAAIARSQGQIEEYERLAREIFAISQEIGDRGSIAGGLDTLSMALEMQGEYAEAHSLIEESCAIYDDLGDRFASASLKCSLGNIKVMLGQYEQAGSQIQMALTLAREIGYRRAVGDSLLLLGRVVLAEEAYAETQGVLQESVTVYREMGQRDELSRALAGLGYAARGLGQLLQAGQYLCETLRTATEIGVFWPLMHALPAIALLLADQGQKERAVELYALASRYPFVANSRWFEDVAGKHIAAVAATLPGAGPGRHRGEAVGRVGRRVCRSGERVAPGG